MFDTWMVFLKEFFKKVFFEKKSADDKKHEKFPRMQRVNSISVSALYLYKQFELRSGSGVIILFPCSTQLSMKFILLINVKMPTIVGILTFISMIYTIPERLKARNFFICLYFSFYEQLKFRAQLS